MDLVFLMIKKYNHLFFLHKKKYFTSSNLMLSED